MRKTFAEKRQKLAQLSQIARSKVAPKVNLGQSSPMELNFSLDGFGKLYHDIGKACESSKLAKISGKYVDLALKLADDMASDLFGDAATAVESEPILKVSDNNESFVDTKSTSDGGYEICSSLDNEVISQQAALQDKVMDNLLFPQVELAPYNICGTVALANEDEEQDKVALDVAFSQSNLTPSEIDVTEVLPSEAPQDNNMKSDVASSQEDPIPNKAYESLRDIMISDTLSSQDNVTPNEADANEVKGLQESMASDMPSSQGNFVPNEAYEVSKSHNKSSNLGLIDNTDDTTAESIVNFLEPNKLGVSKSHDGSSNLGLSGSNIEITAENIVDSLRPNELGGFEDVDLKDDWEDDIDYDLGLVSYYESKKKLSKKKLAAKFISRLRRSMKSRAGEVAHKPDKDAADSDWELL